MTVLHDYGQHVKKHSQGDLQLAKAAFAMHAFHDRAWINYYTVIDELK